MKKDNLELAKQSLTLLLEKMKINFVVFVDDNFEQNPNSSTVIGWLDEAISSLPHAIVDRFEDIDFDNHNVWKQQFNKYWDEVSNEDRYRSTVFISQSLEKSLPHEEVADESLRFLFNNNAYFLSPTDWVAQRETLFATISPENRLLCFFDQDLSLSSGFTPEGTKSGIGLIKATKAQYGELAICCLLSQRIEEIETEVEKWREIASEDLPLSDFLPLAKKRLGNHSAYVFIDGIKKAALNSYFERLKIVTSEIVRSSNERALIDFSKLDPYDFDLMVLISSSYPLKQHNILFYL